MNPIEFGSLNYDISVAALLSAIGLFGFDNTLTAHIAKGVNKMIHESAFLILVAMGSITLFLFVVYPSPPIIFLVVSMLMFEHVEAVNRGKHLFKKYMWKLLISRIGTLVLVPILYLIIGTDGALYGFAISYFLVSYEFFYSLRKIRVSFSTLKSVKTYFLHSYFLSVSRVFTYFLDKIIILPLFGFAIVGYYQFGIQILTVVSILPIILSGYLLPSEAKTKSIHALKKFTLFGTLSSVVFVILLIFTIPYAVETLFPQFSNAILSAQIVLLAGIPLTITSIYNSIFLAHGHTKNAVYGTFIYLGFQSIGIVILGNGFGLIGLSLSTTIAAVLQCSFLILKEYKDNKSGKK
jgi:O-antigen/teichoic acid export membrane protein